MQVHRHMTGRRMSHPHQCQLTRMMVSASCDFAVSPCLFMLVRDVFLLLPAVAFTLACFRLRTLHSIHDEVQNSYCGVLSHPLHALCTSPGWVSSHGVLAPESWPST